MRFCLAASIGLLLAAVYTGTEIGASEIGVTVPVPLPGGLRASIILGVEEDQSSFDVVQDGNTSIYTNDRYRLQITSSKNQTRDIVRVQMERLSGEPFRMSSFALVVPFPKSRIAGIWYPSADPRPDNVMATDADHSIDDVADANYGIPYIAAAAPDARNSLAMGLGRQDLAVSILGKPLDGNLYELRLKALTERTAQVFDESFYISTDTSSTWFETAENYADWVDRLNDYRPFPISPEAYKPLYDAWYWSEDQVDDRLYIETARLASEIGFGSYLADSGWDAAAGEYHKWLSGSTGDYTPPPDKFSDLPATFEQMRSEYKLGINLWLQPYAVGRESYRYAETRDMHIQVPEEYNRSLGWSGLLYPPFALPLGENFESVNLCPRMIPTQTYLKNLFTEMTAKYRPEGYWLDFIDGMPSYCVASHTHDQETFGDGLRKALETIKTTILSSNPRAVVQFRARYANLNKTPFANVFQTGDSPGDFDIMRLGSIRLRPFSKGVIFAADQLYWPDTTDEASVSKFVATSVMVGVPAFGPSLIYSPPETIAILSAWLKFYDTYKMDLANGHLAPFGQLRIPNHKIEGQDRTFVYVRNLDFSELPAGGKTIFIVNASDEDDFNGRVRGPAHVGSYSMTIFDRYLGAEPNPITLKTDADGLLNLRVAVEQGGMIVLKGDEGSDPSSP